MTLLTSDELRSGFARGHEAVDIPRFGAFRCRSLSAKEYTEYQRSLLDKNFNFDSARLIEQKPRLIALSLCDDKGLRLLSDDEWAVVAEWPAAVVERLYAACQRLNGIGEAGLEGDIKNS